MANIVTRVLLLEWINFDPFSEVDVLSPSTGLITLETKQAAGTIRWDKHKFIAYFHQRRTSSLLCVAPEQIFFFYKLWHSTRLFSFLTFLWNQVFNKNTNPSWIQTLILEAILSFSFLGLRWLVWRFEDSWITLTSKSSKACV